MILVGVCLLGFGQGFASETANGADDAVGMTLGLSRVENGEPVGWMGSRGGAWSDFSYDEEKGVATFTLRANWQGFTRQVELPPGHYVFRAVAKANSFAPKLYLDRYPIGRGRTDINVIALGISDEFREVKLPFYVEGLEKKRFQAGIARVYQDPALHEAVVQVKEMEIIRLGDTVLPDQWASEAPVHLLHGLDTLKRISRADRPGRVIFNDSLIGTELWLMTQGGEVNLSYAGSPDFSNEGKYFHAGKRVPGDVVRTDGSFRHKNPLLNRPGSWANKTLWLFPWEEKRLPEGSDRSEWICTSRSDTSISFLNLHTGDTHTLTLPSRPGWRVIQTPSVGTGRGPNIKDITYELLVWQSEDRKQFGLSDPEGNHFRTFAVKSTSAKPKQDVVYPSSKSGIESFPMNSAWGKSGKNWVNAVDKDGTRYFAFEINRHHYLDDENPYQVWMLPLSLTDQRGLLRAVPTPGVKQLRWSERFRPWKGDNWWNLAGGSHRSGDNAILVLEDDTQVHMSALGMHSNFRNTVSVNCAYDREVKFIATYPRLDHISWPHEFRRDRDFATVWSEIVPTVPFVMIDLEHDTLWTVAMKNSYDRAERSAAARRLETPGRPGSGRKPAKLIIPLANPSPDFTKVVYASSMLTVGRPEHEIGDAYIAIARYPQPPTGVKAQGNRLVWEKPGYHAEIVGYRLYRSSESGRGFSRVNGELITGESCPLPAQSKGIYVLTSVEYSGLESRVFSNEAPVGTDATYRRFYESETGRLKKPMVPFFEPKGANNAYAVAVTDPELLYRKKLNDGLEGSVTIEVDVPSGGAARIMARVRGMSGIERSTYTTGWPETGEAGRGSFLVKLDGKQIGKIGVSGFGWKWAALDAGEVSLTPGSHEIELETGDVGIALDGILVTSDLQFIPKTKSNAPAVPPSVPEGLKADGIVVKGEELDWAGYRVKPPYVTLTWDASRAPQGVRYYNVYRADSPDFAASTSTLIGSANEPVYVDCVLDAGKTYYYRVVAIDNWDNRSAGSSVLAVQIM